MNVCGGFLSVGIAREEGKAVLRAKHHGVDGTVLREDAWAAE